jgi:hypothetical protein
MGDPSYVVCIENSDHPASLDLRKIYVRLSGPRAEADGFGRVVDESGEDYLFPARCFAVWIAGSQARGIKDTMCEEG